VSITERGGRGEGLLADLEIFASGTVFDVVLSNIEKTALTRFGYSDKKEEG
jgi:hypothetical protein